MNIHQNIENRIRVDSLTLFVKHKFAQRPVNDPLAVIREAMTIGAEIGVEESKRLMEETRTGINEDRERSNHPK